MQEQQEATEKNPQTQPELTASPESVHRDYSYYREALRGQRMPFAFIDLDLFAENVRQIAGRAAGKRIRIASKSLRSVSILQRILQADPCFQGIMCYTAREALYLAKQGCTDLLLGYPIWQEQDIVDIARASTEGTQITLMIDSVAHVEHIEKIAGREGAKIAVCLDLDMALDVPGLHFGVWRSPLRTPEQARPVIESILASKHVVLEGVMGYEAQIAGVGDNYSGQGLKNRLVQTLQKRSAQVVRERRASIVQLIESYGIQLRFVNGGGTGSIVTTREEPVVTEITVGSGFYAPGLFDNYREFRYQPAAGYAIEIVRRPKANLYTCQGGGYVASGAVGKDKQPKPYLPEGATLTSLEGSGEVQTPVHYSGPISLQEGDPIFMRHAKAGELCERFPYLLGVSQGKVVEKISTYRGNGQCFL